MTKNLEKIKADKTKEAEQVFKQLGIEYDLGYLTINKLIKPEIEKTKPEKLFWTRLSINSSIGTIIE